MEKNLSALGFMSGTSGDGVDSSVISSNGRDSIIIKWIIVFFSFITILQKLLT